MTGSGILGAIMLGGNRCRGGALLGNRPIIGGATVRRKKLPVRRGKIKTSKDNLPFSKFVILV